MITPEQRAKRVESIGSSDAAAILGRSQYANAMDVWLEKTGQLKDRPSTDATELGDVIEPHLVAWTVRKISNWAVGLVSLERNAVLVHPEHPFLVSNTDGVVRDPVDPLAIIEAKTAGLVSPVNLDEWGDEGSEDVPDAYWIQTQFQMACAPKIKEAFIPALLSGRGRVLYRIPRNAEFIAAVVPMLVLFWKENVQAKVPPTNLAPTIESVNRIIRKPNKVVSVPLAAVAEFVEARDARRVWEKEEEERKARLLSLLGDAEAATFPGGKLTYFETQRKGCTVQPYSYRQIRIKKG